MNERCPACGLKFEREEGYFLGAMVISYASGALTISIFATLIWVFTRWRLERDVIGAIVLFLPLVPAITLFSRVLWIYFDQSIDPAED